MAIQQLRDPEWSFGERLAKARRERGLTQEEMAAVLHVSPSTVAKWEANRGQPRRLFDLIARWSEITGISREWLLNSRWNISSPDPQLLDAA